MDSALLAQLAADDCQRMAGLKALLLRKVGKANIEHMADLRTAVLAGLPHDFSPGRGIITLQNGSRIIAGHFQKDSDIDSYLGIEYDIVAVEEATGLSLQKYQQILTCCRSSKPYTPSPSGQLSPLNCQPGRDGSPNRPVHTLDASQPSTLNQVGTVRRTVRSTHSMPLNSQLSTLNFRMAATRLRDDKPRRHRPRLVQAALHSALALA